jgi:glycosyltransferase involved in cell wall biosynthesis
MLPEKKSVVLAIPMYNCSQEITLVLQDLVNNKAEIKHVWILDNKSTDGSINSVINFLKTKKFPYDVTLYQNYQNIGFGGSHKVILQKLLDSEYSAVAVLHGDYQARAKDLVPMIMQFRANGEMIFGARFMAKSMRINYSRMRVIWNGIFNAMVTWRYRKRIYDLGSGLNLFPKDSLPTLGIQSLPDDLTFNVELLKRALSGNVSFMWMPITWVSENQGSNVKVVRQSIKTLKLVLRGEVHEKTQMVDPMVVGEFSCN